VAVCNAAEDECTQFGGPAANAVKVQVLEDQTQLHKRAMLMFALKQMRNDKLSLKSSTVSALLLQQHGPQMSTRSGSSRSREQSCARCNSRCLSLNKAADKRAAEHQKELAEIVRTNAKNMDASSQRAP